MDSGPHDYMHVRKKDQSFYTFVLIVTAAPLTRAFYIILPHFL